MKMVTNLHHSKLTDTRATFPFKSIVECIGEKIWNRNRLKNVILLQFLLEFSKRNRDIRVVYINQTISEKSLHVPHVLNLTSISVPRTISLLKLSVKLRHFRLQWDTEKSKGITETELSP